MPNKPTDTQPPIPSRTFASIRVHSWFNPSLFIPALLSLLTRLSTSMFNVRCSMFDVHSPILSRLSTSGFRFLFIPALLLLAHLPVIFSAFVYDDVKLIPEHPLLAADGFGADLWGRDYGLEFKGTPLGFYRPIFMSVVWLTHTLAGPSPVIFHLISLLAFCLATLLVTRLALSLAPRSPPLALAAGCLYALHPARVETVSLVMSLPDLIVEICALGLILQLVSRRSSPVWRGLLSGALLSTLACLSKESAYFIFPALGITALAHALWNKQWRWSAYTAIATGSLLGPLPALLLRHHAGIQPPNTLSDTLVAMWGERALPVLTTWGHALHEIIIPGPVVFWRLLPAGPASRVAPLALLLLLILCALLWLRSLRAKSPMVPLLTGWLGANLVTLSLLGAEGYPYSQRYLAVAPALLLLAIGLRTLIDKGIALSGTTVVPRRLKHLALLTLITYLAMHGAHTLSGSLTCRTQTRFFTAMRDANPQDVVPWGAVAQSINRDHGPATEIEACIHEATRLDATHSQIPALHDMLIKRYLDDQHPADALRIADWSIPLFPTDTDKWGLRAVALASLARFDEALTQLDAAIAAAPTNTHYQLLRQQIAANSPSPPHE